MFFAFFRLLMIAFSTILVVALVIGALRLFGERQEYTSVPHPLLNERPLIVAWGGDSSAAPAFSAPALQSAADKNFALGLDLRLSRDGVWYVYPNKYLREKGGQFITHFNSTELDQVQFENTNQPLVRFDRIVAQLSQSRFYVVVNNPATPYLESLFKTIEANHLEPHFILSSPFADTTKFIRDRNAQWLTDSTTAETAKAKLLASLFLESLITMTGEVMTLEHPDTRLMQELQKRHVLVLLRTEDSTLVKNLLSEKLISGVVTTRPAQFLAQ
jgi:glycerophosphoryl diester phosphodiesterase